MPSRSKPKKEPTQIGKQSSGAQDRDEKSKTGELINDPAQAELQKDAGSGRGKEKAPHLESGSGRHEHEPGP